MATENTDSKWEYLSLKICSTNYGTTGIGYNRASLQTSATYHSGKVLSCNYDTAGRLQSVSFNGSTYVSSISYAAHGGMTSQTLGNGLLHQIGYNSRLQPTSISLGSLLTLSYNYGSTNNNGNVQSITITPGAGQTPFVQSFTYDALNRLLSATETQNGAQTWKQTYVYDRYGNRWFDAANTTATVLGPLTSASDFNASNNRIVKSGYSYDQAGNLTAEPGKSYAYDAENRLTSAIASGVTTTYVYDGEGRRVRKNAGGVITRMIYNHLGQLVAEYNDSGSLIKEYVYKGSELLASYDASRGAEYATGDHLGSPRIWTNSSGQVIAGGRHDYLPFGEELFAGVANRTTALNHPSTSQADGKRHQFTSKEREVETNLDYFLARYYSSAQGSFTSPDEFSGGPYDLCSFADRASWNPTFYAEITNPQTLNKYQYSLNNPLRYIDPDGHDPEDPQNEGKNEKKLNAEQESVIKIVFSSIFGPVGIALKLLIDPPGAGDDSQPPTFKQLVKSESQEAAIGLVIPGGRFLSSTERSTIKAVRNILGEQLDTKTLQAAAREAAGEVVARKATGEPFNHITKVKQGLQGLIKAERQLSRSLQDKSLSPEARASLKRSLVQTRQAIKRTRKFLEDNNIN